jgi:hypothetical protein
MSFLTVRRSSPSEEYLYTVLNHTTVLTFHPTPCTRIDSKVTYDCRSSTLEECLILMDRVIDCFKSAALYVSLVLLETLPRLSDTTHNLPPLSRHRATGCRISVQKSDEANYAELENNTPLSDAYIRIMQEMFPGYKTEISTGTTASTDFGNVQVEVAGIHPGFCECLGVFSL